MHRLICGLVGTLAATNSGRTIDDILADSDTADAPVPEWDNAQFWSESGPAAGSLPAIRPK